MDLPAGTDDRLHYPALYQEIIHALQPRQGGYYLDGTVGAGGHAWGILQASSPDGLLLGLDVDSQAVEIARRQLQQFGTRAVIVQSTYAELDGELRRIGWDKVDGIVLDLGLSSMQLTAQERGFSFNLDAPLDMRFDSRDPVKAADLVNDLGETELASILLRFGEEKLATPIARGIIRSRPVRTTRQLAEIVSQVKSAHRRRQRGTPVKGRIHPATQTFQALRIAVNHELENLEAALPQAIAALTPRGRLAVISFHSLEDRIVKKYFRQESRDCICPPRQPVCTCDHVASIIEETKRPISPTPEEIRQNPRSRSARLRVAEKIK